MIATGFMSSNSRTWPRLCEKTNHVFARRRSEQNNHVFARRRSEQNNHVFARRRSEQNNHVIARRRSEQNNHVFARRRSRQSNLMTTTIDKLIRWSCITALAFTLSACEINEEPLAAADQTAGTSGGGTPPPPPPPPSATDQAIFESTLYPLLVDANNFCVGCHGATRDPLFAVADASVAYNAVVSQQKVNLVNPALSRIYLRPFEDRHNCGGDVSCDRIAADFLTAIQAWANQAVSSLPPPGTIGQVVVSNMSNFGQAMDGGAARADGSAIALFDFAEGSGDVTMDTSGIGTPITLQIEGMEWVEGGGLRNVSGKAQASLADSRKLFDLITPVNEYSVEAWLIPDNNAQDGPARIVSYSQDTAVRNFTLGQNAIYYQLRNRSDTTGANGTPELEALDPQVDTVLQHVVMTFDAQTGRKVYINGQLSIEENLNTDSLAWQDDQLLVLGNEVTDNRLWQGGLKTGRYSQQGAEWRGGETELRCRHRHHGNHPFRCVGRHRPARVYRYAGDADRCRRLPVRATGICQRCRWHRRQEHPHRGQWRRAGGGTTIPPHRHARHANRHRVVTTGCGHPGAARTG